MKEKNFPLLVFLLGLALGVIGGGAVVYFAKDREGKKMISIDIVPDIVEKVFGLIKKNEKEPENQDKQIGTETLKGNKSETNQVSSRSDEVATELSDSLTSDSLSSPATEEEEIVILQRDQMVGSGSVEIINLDFKADVSGELKNDSILAEAAEVKPEHRITEARVSWMVEYWSSPVNYKGYRIGRNKFIFFGIDPDAPLKVFLFNGKFFLKSNEGIFELEYSGDFLPFQKTNHTAALNAIGNKS